MWNHNVHYHDLILRSLPVRCGRVLDVGCGEGLLARKLADRCDAVVAIDPDRQSLSRAIAQGHGVEYIEGDVMTYPLRDGSFDYITAIATLHHLPLEAALMRFRDLLKPGGTLAVLGLYRQCTMTDYVFAAAALPVSHFLRMFRGYAEVGAPLMGPATSLGDVRAASMRLLPGSVLTRRLFFRYSLVWNKPLTTE